MSYKLLNIKNQKGLASKVILFGIDGATWDIIQPLARDNQLPNFRNLIRNGLTSPLLSTYPPISPPAWVSIFSGVSPGRHGIYDFIKRKPKSYFIEPISSTDIKMPLLWDYAGKAGKTTIALNIPFSFPLHPIKGIITAGLGVPSINSAYAHPQNIAEYIRKSYPDFQPDFGEESFAQKNRQDIFQTVLKVTRAQIELAQDLFLSQRWDIFFPVLRSLDVIQHFFYANPLVLKKAYGLMDEFLGWLMGQMDDTTIMIVLSDHGFRRIRTKIYLNNLLSESNFLKIKPATKLIDAETAEKIINKIGLRPLIYRLKRSQLLELAIGLLISSERISYLKSTDWGKTQVYASGTAGSGLLTQNVLGRESRGIVKNNELYSLYKQIKKILKNYTYQNRHPIKDVVFADSIYPLRSAYPGPDMIAIPNQDFSFAEGYLTNGNICISENIRSGDHSPEGILAIWGKPLKRLKTKSLPDASTIYDIVPTVLHILNIRSDTVFDGNSLL
jgi:predicted AlkP superfamily phosphohydrolase/phosphomutase